jgi:hypothetical protein
LKTAGGALASPRFCGWFFGLRRNVFPVDPPARTVCGARLIGGRKVEIECVALA